MLSALRQFGITRLLASLVFGAVLLGCMYGFHRGWSAEGYRVPGALDLSGEWEFHNGKYSPYEALAMPFYQRVQVPKPLPAQIKAKLAEEYWYRKRFKLPRMVGPLAISFGAIKGEHSVYWNGRYLGAGAQTGMAVYRIPPEYLIQDEVTVAVRVKRYETLFPGIVNLLSVVLGDAEAISRHEAIYYYEQGVRPILAGTVKFFFALVFLSLFLATPRKREYLPFALFALFSGASTMIGSKFLPFYDSYYFKNALQFVCSSIALATIPFVTGAFLRFPEDLRSYSRSFGFAAPLVFFLAALMVPTKDGALNVYTMANEWLPVIVGLPCVAACLWSFVRMTSTLRHRRRQIFFFGLSLLFGTCTWSGIAPGFYNFQLLKYFYFLDSLIFLGLALALVLDFKVLANRSELAGKSVPKWFAGFLATGTRDVRFEIGMVVIAVDTAGYTKKLAGLNSADKDLLHKEIRDLLQPLGEAYGAQKLSDGGDGGLFAWDTPAQGGEAWQEVIAAIRYIANVKGPKFGVQFRVGMATGKVRCELRNSDFSFMGEALNTAARLEAMSKVGEPLVDATAADLLTSGLVADAWVEAELKGVIYRGRALKNVA